MHLPTFMNSVNPLLYVTGISVTLLVVYLLSSLDINKKSQWISALYWWAKRKNKKLETGSKTWTISTVPSKTYSKNWWKDPKVFELERRAIFSQEWFFVTHAFRFTKAGDYRTFEIAGFSFIVILGKDKQIRTFHNVCRHRAYAVTKKEIGSSAVLGCRYHGWSYDTRGKLIKAPEFDTVEGFEKEANSLWEIRTQVRDSMIFVSFDNRSDAASLKLNKAAKLPKKWGMAKLSSLSDWKVEGAFNWKLAVSLQNSSQGQVSLPWYVRLQTWIQDQRKDLNILRTTIVRRHESGVVIFIKVVPKSPTATTLECSLFGLDLAAPVATVENIQKQISIEVDGLISNQRELLYSQEHLLELVAANQHEISQILKDHADAESQVGTEIHPAASSQSLTIGGKADDDCKLDLVSRSYSVFR